MKHLMVDLETWGVRPGCDIRSIGAVLFDPTTGELGGQFYVATENPLIVIPSGRIPRYNLHRDPATVKWWSEQSSEAQAAFQDRVELHAAMQKFSDFYAETGAETFWCKGPHFDEAILAACYRAVGLLAPWSHRAPRDCRTIEEAAGGVELAFEGTEHNALDDAIFQAKCVIEAYRKLGLRQFSSEDCA